MKRDIPSELEIRRRAQYLARQKSLPILEIVTPSLAPGLEQGNIKTGFSGKHIGRILVWNLPTLRTCPGASGWCASNCYNGDTSGEIEFNRPLWYANELHARDNPQALGRLILQQIADESKGVSPSVVATRVHSSGDFFSSAYISMWRDISSAVPQHLFWA
ncbi:GP88 family protein, partial [Streptomyces sp. NPDC055299]